MAENLDRFIGKRCEVKKTRERGIITGTTRRGTRTLFNVDLDKEDLLMLHSYDALFIENELHKYPPHEPSNQRDNNESARVRSNTSSNSNQVLSAPETNHDTTVLPVNSLNQGIVHVRRSLDVSTARGTKRKRTATRDESSTDESSGDSSSDTEVEDEAPDPEEWTVVDNVVEEKGHKYTGLSTTLRWNTVGLTFTDAGVKDPIQYFRLFFPMNTVSRILAATNEGVMEQDKIMDDDFWRYIGIRLAFVLQPVPFGIKEGAFGTGKIEGTLFEKGNYGSKYGMSRNRFFFIDEKLKFCQFTEVSDAEKQQVHA